MMEATWHFGRGAERLRIERRPHGDGSWAFVIAADGTLPRVSLFSDPAALTRFQSDMEELLLHTGWMLLRFEPERRRGRDRRLFPRVRERRRWWTG